MNYWTQSEKNIYVAAHRGCSTKYPENTMAAFRAAVEAEVDQIEIDVHETKDGELVIIHDDKVDRTTDGKGKVRDMTLAEIKGLDAGIKKGERFKGERIPTLTEFMELIKDHPTMTVDVELKVYPTEGNEEYAYGVCDRILAVVDKYGYTDRCVINTWNGKLHEYVRDKYGDKYKQHLYYPVKHLGACTRDPYTYGYCVCMFGDKDAREYIASREEFDFMKQKYGIRTWAGAGVNNEERVLAAIECGAELITCNDPEKIMEILRKHGYHK